MSSPFKNNNLSLFKYSKDSIQYRLYCIYVELRNIDNSNDYTGLKQLLTLMKSTKKALEAEGDTSDTESDYESFLFLQAIRKLPSDIRVKCLQQPRLQKHQYHNTSLNNNNETAIITSFNELILWLTNHLYSKKRKHSQT